MSLGSNGADWMRSLKKFPTWLRGTNFCINCTSWLRFSPSLLQLQNDPKCTQTLCNKPKYEVRVQWSGLGAFVAKIPTWLRGMNYCISCTSSHCFTPSFKQLWNDPKCIQTLCNTRKHEFRVQWGGLGYEKSRRDFVARTFALIAPVDPVLHWVSYGYETIPNAPNLYATHQNMSLGSNGVDWMLLVRKIPTRLRGTNFCNNCTSSPCFASSFMQLRNDPKYIPTLCNAPKHEFRVQCGGLGAFVETNPDVTSWHELLH